jgi:formylglycine-generating enzyme required for sulfatase activity
MYRILFVLGLALTGFAFAYAATRSWNVSPSGPLVTVWIPGGEFTVGPDSDLGWSDENLGHRVRVDAFWMDEADVTNAQLGTSAEKMIT